MVREKLEVSPTHKVVSQVNHLGLTEAAEKLGVSKSTLVRWLKQRGYQIKRIYVKEGEQTA
jgi:excisionase family DNA binding protein